MVTAVVQIIKVEMFEGAALLTTEYGETWRVCMDGFGMPLIERVENADGN